MVANSLLSEEELAALQEGVSSGAIAVDTGFNQKVHVRKHDLASEDSTLGINVGAIEMINERFLRLFRLGLVEVLRSTPKITPLKAEIVRYGDYLRMLKSPLSVNMVRVDPLRGNSLVVIEPNVIFNSLDIFFGGFGTGINKGPLPPTRLFTPTETRVIGIILDVFSRSLREAWAPLLKLDFRIVSAEINPQFAQIADEGDLVVLSRFEVDSGPGSFIDLVYPYAALKPIRDVLRSRVQTGDANETSEQVWRNDLRDAVFESELELQTVLGTLQTTLHTLTNLKVGDVLYFKKQDLARVNIADIPAYDVDVGIVDAQLAAQIQNAIDITGKPILVESAPA
ncbi:MAG: Flagellar motor switch protein FliM [Pseudomonadota bacterium]|jgi:flagellar motor switch protein FliM